MALEKLQNADFVRRAQANFDTIGERGNVPANGTL